MFGSRERPSPCLRELGSKEPRHAVWSTPPQSQFPFLELPEDVVILIISFLPHPDKFSAALACKSLHFICDNILGKVAVLVSREHKEDFLLRLERDLIATHHYCAICMRLHRFSSLNKPNENPCAVLRPDIPACLGYRYQNSPTFAKNHFAYHHGRAAMNRHFYGAPAGLDPDSLCYETSYQYFNDQRECTTWSSRYSVRIICDSLFLFGEHAMDSPDVPSMITRLDRGLYDVCRHTTTSALPDRVNYSTRATGLDASEISRSLREPGRVVHGSCAGCLTDYTVEITRDCRGGGVEVFYRVKLQTYHDFGQFRSPEEWKWRAWRRKSFEYDAARPRDMIVYPPGSVYQRYHAAKDTCSA